MAVERSASSWPVRLLVVAAFGYVVAAVAASALLFYAADRWWPATALAFGPRWLLALPLPAVFAIAFLARRWRWRLLAGAAIAAIALALAIDVRVPLGRAGAGGGPPLVVLTLNAAGEQTSIARLKRLLDDQGIQIAAVQECDLDPADWLEGGFTLMRDDGMCLLSRFPVRDVEVREPADIKSFGGHGAAVRYSIETPAGALTVVNLHLATVRDGLDALIEHGLRGRAALSANSAMRERESAMLRTWVDSVTAGQPALVLGDFNMPVESAIYRRHWSSLANAFSSCGAGLGWSKRTRRFGIRIDHVLMGEGFRCASAAVAADVGSDHRGIVARLTAPAAR